MSTIIQTDLARLGYSPGRIDGIIGRRTIAALDAAGIPFADVETGEAARILADRISEEARDHILPDLETMQALAPNFPQAWVLPLWGAIERAHITPDRLSMFLAQLAHESAGFATLEEFASGSDYEGRADLGNTETGDGVRFKGRGPIQITGRANYTRYGAMIGEDLVSTPSAAKRASRVPAIGFALSAAYWIDRNLNALVDADDFEALTRAINGGLNGIDDRLIWLERARALFDGGGDVKEAAPPQTDPVLIPDETDGAEFVAIVESPFEFPFEPDSPPTPSPEPPHPAPSPSPEPTMAASPQPKRRTPVRSWLLDNLSKDAREECTGLLYDYFDDQKLWLVGQYQGYLDDGIPPRRAIWQTRRDFFTLVVEELADRADDAVSWDRVKRKDVRTALEALDGFVFKALLNGALNMAAARLLGTASGFAGLLTAAETAQDAMEDDDAPTVVIGNPERPEHLRRVDVPLFHAPAEDVPEPSAQTVKARLSGLLDKDRAVTRTRSILATLPKPPVSP